MRPRVICHMIASLDGGIHPSCWTTSPDGSRAQWSGLYEAIHQTLEADAWMVGRVTMAEMSKAGPHAPAAPGAVDRPLHRAAGASGCRAVALDPAGRLHFSGPDMGGDPVVVVLGRDVPDSHLAELEGDGVSYMVAGQARPDLAEMLDVLGQAFGIRRLLLEGGATINGSFLAAGLVDEVSLLVAPTLDGRAGNQGFAEFGDEGLAGRLQLSLLSCTPLEHGLLHLRYAARADGPAR